MKSLLSLILLSFCFSAFAQWTHYGEEPAKGPDCNGYHSWDVEGCEEVTARRRAEADHKYKVGVAKQKLAEADPEYLEMLSSFKGCKKVDVYSKNLDKMNQAELCRRQLMNKLESEGYFKDLEFLMNNEA